MKKRVFLLISFVVSTLLIMGQNQDFEQLIKNIKKEFASDGRVELFDIEGTQQNNSLILTGKTTSKLAYNKLISEIQKRGIDVKDKILLLPDKALGDEIWGIAYNSVGTIRSDKKYSSELVSQILMGTPVRILEKEGEWRRVQTPDKYIGWINGSIQPISKSALQHYLKQPQIIVTAFNAKAYSKSDVNSSPISDLVAGDMLVVKNETPDFFHVVYPDKRKAYISKNDAKSLNTWLNDIQLTGESLVHTAKQFMGIPYLWGGTSTKGVDCSGFTKTVYFLHGIILARDASQQVRYGKLIDEKGDFENALPGDLVFFGEKDKENNGRERVVHVGIYIGNKRFIHASDYVRISSFDANDALYDEYNTNRYLRTKRIIGEVNNKGIDEILNNEFYQ